MTPAKRLFSFFLAVVLALTCVIAATPAAMAAGANASTPQTHPNTYVNVGDQRKDIIGVALTQVGYVEGYNNNNKYGAALNINNLGWCGAFVSWCAIQAGIPDSILPKTGVPSPASYGLTALYYPAYTPQPGDLFFEPSNSHVGLVWYVEGDSFYTVEGNYSNGVYTAKRKLSSVKFGAPAYEVTAQTLYSGTCGDNVKWTLNDLGTLNISGSGAMDNFTYANGYAPWYAHNDSIHNVVIRSGVTSISDNAFRDCTTLTAISISTSVLSIGKYAFSGCTGLTGITLPNSIKSIQDGAFSGCDGLTDISIPASVTTLTGYPFGGCANLAGIWVEDGNTCFSNDIEGVLFNIDQTKLLRAPKVLSGSYTVPDTVKNIGYYAFEGCAKLRSVTLPQGLTVIEGGAFEGCTRLTEVSIPEGVTTVSHYAFARCTALTGITLPDSVTAIEHYAFNGCASLSSITIPASVKSLGQGAFDGCSALTSVSLQAKLSGIDQGVFKGCSALSSITLPNGITTIGRDAFSGCAALATIHIPEGVTEIGRSAFEGCTGLTAVTLPASVGFIDYCAFLDCNRLGTVFFRGTSKQSILVDGENAALTGATWHCSVTERLFAEQSCYYCAECATCFLADGSVALATVTFLNHDGSTISSTQYRYGDSVTVPTLFPRPADMRFVGWDKPIENCTGNETYRAVFEKLQPPSGTGTTAGDTNGDQSLNNDDVVYLLWNLLFGDEYPLVCDGDFTGDNALNNDDVVYLLWHLLFGDEYPLS